MILIRQEQMRVFSAAAAARFEHDIAAMLRAHHPAHIEALTQQELSRLVHEGSLKAQAFGLDEDDDIVRFVTLLMVVGWSFDRYPPFERILHPPASSRAPGERFQDLLDDTTFFQWEEAAAHSAEQAGDD